MLPARAELKVPRYSRAVTDRAVNLTARWPERTSRTNYEAAYPRSLPSEEALAGPKELPGIGDFSAELVLLRGVGESDGLPSREPRLARTFAMAYGLVRSPPSKNRGRL